jgi:hypothetical protein
MNAARDIPDTECNIWVTVMWEATQPMILTDPARPIAGTPCGDGRATMCRSPFRRRGLLFFVHD